MEGIANAPLATPVSSVSRLGRRQVCLGLILSLCQGNWTCRGARLAVTDQGI